QPALVLGPADAQAAVRQRDALGRLALRPPLVERTPTDPEIGANLRDGELVPLAAAPTPSAPSTAVPPSHQAAPVVRPKPASRPAQQLVHGDCPSGEIRQQWTPRGILDLERGQAIAPSAGSVWGACLLCMLRKRVVGPRP